MAEKATSAKNASEGEGEKASAQMENLTLAPPPGSEEKNASSPEVDLSVVLALLQQTQYSTYIEPTSKMEDLVFITAAAAKALLSPEGAAGKQLGKLMETKEFLPFLLKCLRETGDLPSSVQENAAWLVGTIIKHGEKYHIFKLSLTEAVTLLVKVVNTSDPGVREQVTSTIAVIADDPILRKDLLTTEASIDLCNALTKLLKMKRSVPSNEVLNNVSKIIYNLLLGNVRNPHADDRTSREVMASQMPSQYIVMRVLPVISILLDFPKAEARRNLLPCLCISAVVLSSITPFIVNNLCPKLVRYLEWATEGHHTVMGTAIALGTICAKGPTNFLKFLESVSGTCGLRNFWKCLQLAGKLENEDVKSAIYDVMNIIPSLVYLNSDDRGTADLIFDSGIVHAFVTSLQKDVPESLQLMALNNVGFLSSKLSVSRKAELIDQSILTYAAKFLKSFNSDAVEAASLAVGMLVAYYPKGRDEAISVGILPILLDILRKRTGTIPADVTHSCLLALHIILEVKPKIAIDAFKDVLETLKIFFEKNAVANGDDAVKANVTAAECVMQFTNFGNEGIDQIFATPSLAQKVISFLICRTAELQQVAVEIAKRICQQGTVQHRRKLLELNILEHLKDPLQGPLPENRQFALECLLELLDEELTAKQKRDVKNLSQIVKTPSDVRNVR